MTYIIWILGVSVIPMTVWAFTGLIRWYALQKGALDIPNSRSSHAVPTPRGGGLSFVTVFLLCTLVLGATTAISRRIVTGLVGGGLLVAWVGWIDDRRGLSAGLRAVVHLLASAWGVYWIGGLSEIVLGDSALGLGLPGSLFAVVAIVWCINLYNFMDGIDGIAAAEAVTTTGFAGLLSLLVGNLPVAYLCFALALAVSGFFPWNWPPARIFMGDAGSGFLGFVLAYLALMSEKTGGIAIIAWAILLSTFVVDATLTLVWRGLSGERLYEAHRSHVYQLAVQAGHSHKQVTACVAFLNIGLGGAAFIAVRFQDLLLPVFATVGSLLVTVYLNLRRKWGSTYMGTRRLRKLVN